MHNVITMKTHIIRIGNSQGIRIPKPLLKQCHFEGELEIESSPHKLVILSRQGPRKGWKEAFTEMGENKDDKLIKGYPNPRSWSKEWVWK